MTSPAVKVNRYDVTRRTSKMEMIRDHHPAVTVGTDFFSITTRKPLKMK
jgi:hypothetical protein